MKRKHATVVLRDEDELLAWIREAQTWVLRHPVAAQAIYRALVAEGRRFAGTPDGRRWKAKLEASETMRRASAMWGESALNALVDSGDSIIPPSFLDAALGVAMTNGLDSLLAHFLPNRGNHATTRDPRA